MEFNRSKGRQRWSDREKQAKKRRFFKTLRLKQKIPKEERQMLEETVRLDDGTYGECVAFRKNENGLVYECHLCKCYAKNLTYQNFLPHYRGRTHKMNLLKPVHSKNNFILKRPNTKLKLNLNTGPLAPCKIQGALDRFTRPLIGLEYVLEIVVPREPLSYYCLLCCKQINLGSSFTHLTSQGHYLQYFYMFFRTAANELMKGRGNSRKKADIRDKIEALAGKIEKYFGRLKPRCVTLFEMENKLSSILDSIDSGPHFWETPDRTFVEHLDNASGQANLYRANDSPDQSAYDPFMQDLEYGSISPPPDENDPSSIQGDEVNTDISRLDEDERRFYEFTHSGPTNRLMWTIYREKVQQMEADLLEEMVYYQQNPEKHPKYEMERIKYYTERTEFLLRDGKDSMSYDIKGEFISLWETLLRDMFYDIFKKEKTDLRQQLLTIHKEQTGQSMEDEQQQTEVRDYNRSSTKRSNYDSSSNEDAQSHNDGYKFNMTSTFKRSYDPLNQNDAPPEAEFQEYNRASTNKRSYNTLSLENQSSDPSSKRSRQTHNVEESANITSNEFVLSVLRHLSVLEDMLGSLGPKVVDLLSEALLLDKTSSDDSVLLNEKNCLLLETVKEKLIGILQAGILKPSMKAVAEKSICNIIKLSVAVEKEKRSYSDKKRSRDESSYGGPSTSYRNEQKSYSDTKNQVNRPPYQEDRKPYKEEGKSYHEERKPYQEDRKTYHEERKPYQEEGKSYHEERKPYQEDRKTYHEERKPYQEEKQSFYYKPTKYSPSHSSKHGNMSENVRSFKVSEISDFIENLETLSHLPFLEKTSISQEIASALIFKRQTEIKKDELLKLINRFFVKKVLKQERSSVDFFDKTTSSYQQATRDYNRYSPADDSAPGTSLSTFPNVYESPAHSALKTLFGTESNPYLQNKEKSNSTGGNRSNIGYDSSLLNNDFFRISSYRPY